MCPWYQWNRRLGNSRHGLDNLEKEKICETQTETNGWAACRCHIHTHCGDTHIAAQLPLLFSLLCHWLAGGFGGRGYLNDYSWLRCCDGKRCLGWSREQGLELQRETDRRERELLCCIAEK